MSPNHEPATSSSPPHPKHPRWYQLGILGVATGLLTTVGLAGVEKIREASARSQ